MPEDASLSGRNLKLRAESFALLSIHRYAEDLIVAPVRLLDYCRIAPSIAPLCFPWHQDNAMNKSFG
jgi:hypothetical protein